MEEMLKNFRLYFPLIAEDMVDAKIVEDQKILCTLKDGHAVYFDNLYKSIHNVRPTKEYTDAEWQKEVGLRIWRKMDLAHMTQTELAAKTGLSNATISNYLHGVVAPSYRAMHKIAKTLKCSMDDFANI